MAGSVNKVVLVGNVGKDPEVRNTQAGGRIVNLSLATSESWTDKRSGERQERTEWHRVVIFNERLADVVEKYVHKGSKLYLEGQLQTRKWTDQAGVERYSTEVVLSQFRGEVVLLGDRRGDDAGGDGRSGESYGRGSAGKPTESYGGGTRSMSDRAGGGFGTAGADLDDEIPF